MQRKRIDPRAYWDRFHKAMRKREQAAFQEEVKGLQRAEEAHALGFLGLAQLERADEVSTEMSARVIPD